MSPCLLVSIAYHLSVCFQHVSPISKELHEIFRIQTFSAFTSKVLEDCLQIISTNIHKWGGVRFLSARRATIFIAYSFYLPNAFVIVYYASKLWSLLSVLLRKALCYQLCNVTQYIYEYCTLEQIWGTCTLIESFLFMPLSTYTPLHLRCRYCTFYSTTFIWQL